MMDIDGHKFAGASDFASSTAVIFIYVNPLNLVV